MKGINKFSLSLALSIRCVVFVLILLPSQLFSEEALISFRQMILIVHDLMIVFGSFY